MADELEPSMGVRIYGDASQLDKTLKETEKKVDESGKTMGDKVEKSMTGVADKLGRKIAKLIGAGFAIKALDDSLKIIAEGIKHGKGANEIALAIGDSILDGLRRVPIAGALGEILAMVFDPLMGDPEAVKRAREKYGASQQREKEIERGLQKLSGVSADPATSAKLKAEAEIRRLREEEDRLISLLPQERKLTAEGQSVLAKKMREQLAKYPTFKTLDPVTQASVEQKELERIMPELEQFKMAPGLTEQGIKQQGQIRAAVQAAIDRVEAELAAELVKKSKKASEIISGQDGMLPDMDIPEVDVEDAIEDLHDTIAEHGSEAIVSDSRMVGIATEQLTELKEMRRSLTAIAARQNGFSP